MFSESDYQRTFLRFKEPYSFDYAYVYNPEIIIKKLEWAITENLEDPSPECQILPLRYFRDKLIEGQEINLRAGEIVLEKKGQVVLDWIAEKISSLTKISSTPIREKNPDPTIFVGEYDTTFLFFEVLRKSIIKKGSISGAGFVYHEAKRYNVIREMTVPEFTEFLKRYDITIERESLEYRETNDRRALFDNLYEFFKLEAITNRKLAK
jgi:hypothetical protein